MLLEKTYYWLVDLATAFIKSSQNILFTAVEEFLALNFFIILSFFSGTNPFITEILC